MNYFLILASTLFVYMSIWFFISLVKKRNNVADVAWGFGFILISWASFLLSGSFDLRALIVCTLVSIWGIRLAIHIYNRNKNKTEDYRYLEWRKQWGNYFYIRSYLQVYLLQGLLLFLIALPVIIINKNSEIMIGWFDLLAVLVWFFGFYFETIGDLQLAKFIKDPANKGKLMKSGLWAYTRHPNYFGEVVQWWGIWLFALSIPMGILTIIGPLTITFLILKVSGIPMLEKKMEKNPEFEDYKKKVNMFFPIPKLHIFKK